MGVQTLHKHFFGEIGKAAAQDHYYKSIAKLEPALNTLVIPEESVINDLSSDQRLLLECVWYKFRYA